ncbi:MAG: Lrp/AsnC family transcriptional regulator [Alistipes sp.]|jgi:Lrp/AsnC family transcriptional regulator for asnA, asnC and gidA|nr:Lrp/AsnC family transcriptional regulator [Alistipes sp.]MBR0393586.1 Lrp/AsnC family transcriptional regulator [Alistipes sp.]
MSKITLDDTDRKILRFLVKNARMPFLEIARECGISGAAIHQRIKKLEDAGVIRGSHMSVDPRMLGFDICAFVNIRLRDNSYSAALNERLKTIPEIVECHTITGNYTVMVKLYCVDNNHLMNTLNAIRTVPSIATETYISLDESFKREPPIDCLDKINFIK